MLIALPIGSLMGHVGYKLIFPLFVFPFYTYSIKTFQHQKQRCNEEMKNLLGTFQMV